MGPSWGSRRVGLAGALLAWAAGCAAVPPGSDAGSTDAQGSACDRARALARAGIELRSIDHVESLARSPIERPRVVPTAWTDVGSACFDVRIEARTVGEPFPIFVFSGIADSAFELTDATGTTLRAGTPADVGGGVRRFDFFVPASLSSAFLIQSQPCARSGEIETRRFPLAFDDVVSAAVVAEAECIDCRSSCSGVRCASPATRVATAHGARAIASLRVGDPVWSVDGGALVLVPLVRVVRARVARHHVVRVVLDDGAVLEMSPGHPLADGGTFAELRPGSSMGDARVVSATYVPYAYDATYDVLPASDTGVYFAEGVPVGSTLAVAPRSATAWSRSACHPSPFRSCSADPASRCP